MLDEVYLSKRRLCGEISRILQKKIFFINEIKETLNSNEVSLDQGVYVMFLGKNLSLTPECKNSKEIFTSVCTFSLNDEKCLSTGLFSSRWTTLYAFRNCT